MDDRLGLLRPGRGFCVEPAGFLAPGELRTKENVLGRANKVYTGVETANFGRGYTGSNGLCFDGGGQFGGSCGDCFMMWQMRL